MGRSVPSYWFRPQRILQTHRDALLAVAEMLERLAVSDVRPDKLRELAGLARDAAEVLRRAV